MQSDLDVYSKFLIVAMKPNDVDVDTKIANLNTTIACFDSKAAANANGFKEAIDKNSNDILTILENTKVAKNVDVVVFAIK